MLSSSWILFSSPPCLPPSSRWRTQEYLDLADHHMATDLTDSDRNALKKAGNKLKTFVLPNARSDSSPLPLFPRLVLLLPVLNMVRFCIVCVRVQPRLRWHPCRGRSRVRARD
jgi:hypothetical protein